ncbi:hypothetical protein M409DRAFT_17533 [Zasmidium cellare ATCC 36951]|uniref:Uncharacterized protein n=1 Tax=Zasmidium cellare ATCC 36951 TaxID=1080233 RepID=A0A6A6D1K1_ZASCE|nr:uncharacterized protein M409DRAFT_17533 [Zasmidium cellare ATCC 36951]KAF2172298.1 hypothetical protein M409DRAFT_17533 [Zasmidium cellare ATCC 36951]
MNAIKTYNVTRDSGWNYRHLQVQHNNQTFLWVNTSGSGFLNARPRMHLQTQSEHGPVVAAAALKASSASCRVMLGNPDATAKDDWIDVHSDKTHDKDLGASSSRNTHFKLLDGQNESQVLAVYIQDRKWFDSSNVAKIDYFAELDPNLELLSLAAIFGIEDRIRRKKNNSNAAVVAATS